MIDIKAARNDPDGYRAALARKDAADAFDQVLEADREWLSLLPRVEDLRGRTKLKGKPTPEQLEELTRLKEELRQAEEELAQAERRRDELLTVIPNPPAEDTPDGFTDDDAVVVRQVGDAPAFDFPARDHLRLALRLPRRRRGAARARAVPLRTRPAGREGVRADAAAGARSRGSDVRHR